MINRTYLEQLEEYISSGDLEDHFAHSTEARRYEILEFLEKFMHVADLADEAATRIVFKGRRESFFEERKSL